MRRILYSPIADRLIYLDAQATPEFWDSRWRAEGRPTRSREDESVVITTARHLPAHARVLEGGCGRGNKVKALSDAGFDAVGIDFAPESVRESRSRYPGLDIREGDVRALPFPAGEFDGYWSIGVIEHFWIGYDAILAEAYRVLRPGRVLFLTAPWFSPYRRLKARKGGYPRCHFTSEPGDFYQFALGRQEVSEALHRHGFRLVQWRGIAPEISIQEDMDSSRGPLKWVFGSRGSFSKRVLRRLTSNVLRGFCGHSFMAIALRNRFVHGGQH